MYLITRYGSNGKVIVQYCGTVAEAKKKDDIARGLVIADYPITGVERFYLFNEELNIWRRVGFYEFLDWLTTGRLKGKAA
jgi:hypothetical protein